MHTCLDVFEIPGIYLLIVLLFCIFCFIYLQYITCVFSVGVIMFKTHCFSLAPDVSYSDLLWGLLGSLRWTQQSSPRRVVVTVRFGWMVRWPSGPFFSWAKNQWRFQEKLEVPTRSISGVSGLCFREYLFKIWYGTSILGSWNSRKFPGNLGEGTCTSSYLQWDLFPIERHVNSSYPQKWAWKWEENWDVSRLNPTVHGILSWCGDLGYVYLYIVVLDSSNKTFVA